MRKMILFLALLLGVTSVYAQKQELLTVKRFSASRSQATQYLGWSKTPSLKNSQTDTTEFFKFSNTNILDTLLEAVVFSTNADSLKGKYQVQYATSNGLVISTGVADSITYNVPGSSESFPAHGKQLWFTRPGGASAVRVIVTTAATMNEGGYLGTPTKTYSVGITTRFKKEK